MKLFLYSLAALLPLCAQAEFSPWNLAVRCGGKYAGQELKFSLNPINSVFTAHTPDETFSVYVDTTRGEKVRVVTAETVTDEQWKKLKALRDASIDESLRLLISTLGSTKQTEMWIGWTNDGFIHFEGKQRDAKFSFSCQKDNFGATTTPKPVEEKKDWWKSPRIPLF
jgi:hypothetical protein